MSARHCRAYLERHIDQCRELEQKLMDFSSSGNLPRPRLHQEPGPEARACAASRAGDIASERMTLQAALRELDR